LRKIQFVETNPTQLRAFQEPSSGYELEPTGSNAASFFEGLSESHRQELIDNLAAVVPGICDVGARKFSNRVTIAFYQLVNSRRREFLANQMSDGTLRAFAILLAILQDHRPDIVIIEEPEVAIHLGALRVLVDILQAHSREIQMAITTHSADIVDSLNVDDLRVIWSEDGASHLARVAAHTRATVREGLVSSGDLLRADALDPAVS
jgi:predicted ATPase